MVRVVLGGPGRTGCTAGQYADHYVKPLFAPDGVSHWRRGHDEDGRQPPSRTSTPRPNGT